MVQFYDGMFSRYGNLNLVCPSPLLSALLQGCLETGRDLTAGGARYHIIAPLMNGTTTAIDALWAIKRLVFDDEAVTTLPELRECLICDWGFDMKAPFQSSFAAPVRSDLRAQRYKQLRDKALGLPKFGEGDSEVDAFADQVVADLVEIARDTIQNPILAAKLDDLRARYSTPEREFEFVVTPGIATFEDYIGLGLGLGASADGRRNNMPLASDLSPSPSPQDLPVDHREREVFAALQGWNTEAISVGLANGSPVDINIREDFPLETLQDVVRAFARGEIGSNMLSISCADPSTLERAQRDPERFDLVRLRMGGWSEFFVTMFPRHQEQHRRRPIFLAREKKKRMTS